MNVIALLGLLCFVLKVVPAAEREPWLWSVALVSVNPLAVLFHRKIWPPCLYPLIITLFLLCWWYRQRRLGAVGWGLIGACLGQIQGAGFFFAAGFVLWALLFDRKGVAWVSWVVGSILGTLPMLPWIHYMLTEAVIKPHTPGHWLHMFEGKFWTRWLLEPIGFGLDYSLGRDFSDFLRYPLVGGSPTYLVGLLHVLIGIFGGVILLRAVRRTWQSKTSLAKFDGGRASETAFTQNAALWGYGLLLTLSCLPVNRQYMILLFPLEFVWLARLALGPVGQSAPTIQLGRRLLAALVICQGLISIQFLTYIHTHTAIHGDYGPPYRVQLHVREHERTIEQE